MAADLRFGEDGRVEPIEIIVADLLIRPWRPDDAEALYLACQDPDIQRWTSVPSPYRRADAHEFVGVRAPAGWANGTAAPMGVFDLATGLLLGSCRLAGISPPASGDEPARSAAIVYWTVPGVRGRGIALTAVRAVATWAFSFFGLSQLIWTAELGNHAARLVALRAGVQITGEHRLVRPGQESHPLCWIGSLQPGEVTGETPERYATGSLVARRAAVFGSPVPDLPLVSGAGRLRGWRDTDVADATLACQDPESARWTAIPMPYGHTDAEFYIHQHVPMQWARGQAAGFVVADDGDRFVGSIDLRLNPADEGSAEIGFLVAPWARGRGYAPSAVRTLCAWGFAALSLERIVWMAYLGNDRSRRVAEKAGFTAEGIGRRLCVQRGRRIDAWVGARLATDPD
jgi:RimJ/RimL family protein N-acetyltransferase